MWLARVICNLPSSRRANSSPDTHRTSLNEWDLEHPGPHLGAETLRGVAFLLCDWLLGSTL
jgi:hypothetical protein